jgi:hypothetical protein
MYQITVKNKLGEVFLKTKPIIREEIPGLLSIIDSPGMFGSSDFEVTIQRITGGILQ